MKVALIVYGEVANENSAGEVLVDSATALTQIETQIENLLPVAAYPRDANGGIVLSLPIEWGGVTVRELGE